MLFESLAQADSLHPFRRDRVIHPQDLGQLKLVSMNINKDRREISDDFYIADTLQDFSGFSIPDLDQDAAMILIPIVPEDVVRCPDIISDPPRPSGPSRSYLPGRPEAGEI